MRSILVKKKKSNKRKNVKKQIQSDKKCPIKLIESLCKNQLLPQI